MKVTQEQQQLIHEICQKAAATQINKHRHIATREPELEEYFFQTAYLRLWELTQKGKIDFNHPRVKSYLRTKAWAAIIDEIREKIVPIKRTAQLRKKLWHCPDCGFKTTYHEHRVTKKNKNICPCGIKITWTFDPLDNPLRTIQNWSQLKRQETNDLDNFPGNFEDPRLVVERFDEVEHLLTIDDELRTVLELRYMEEMTLPEVASKFRRGITWVHFKTKEAKKECKARLESAA